MEIRICKDPKELGKSAAKYVAEAIRECIKEKGSARIALSTGASQFDTISELVKEDVDWSKVEMFHLDEYVDLDESHGASFRKYLKERFCEKLPIPLKKAHFVDGKAESIPELTREITKEPIDIGLIGIGENAHIAFNDPPADFDTKESYIVVNLDTACRNQQMGEGWFKTFDEVPKQAVSMTVHQIMSCRKIVSCVPYAVKANAIEKTIHTKETTPLVPATKLKEHSDFILYVDMDSAKGILK
ncbi:MAG: glucosamine-6-phosphate deaminase [Ruminococcaceae bacterium]|nr:glucosamine-6-phosphate deaminase [Oscillospiraceae bacterium]